MATHPTKTTPRRTANADRSSPAEGAPGKRLAVPAAARTMTLFEIFSREKRELTKSEAARLLGLPESSASDLLSTLFELGYLSRTPITRRYYPTNLLLGWMSDIADHSPIAALGQRATNVLAECTGESSFCGIVVDDHVELIATTPGTQRLRYVAAVGDSYPLHSTAIGKALLSQLDDAEVDRLLGLRPLVAVTETTMTTPEAVKADISSSKRGVYRTNREGSRDSSALAVAATVHDQNVGLCVIGPTDRLVANARAIEKALLDVRTQVLGS